MPSLATPPLRLLADKTDDAAYCPSYEIGAADLGSAQLAAVEAVAEIAGWLRPEDALKLYELAYYAAGPILEIGAYRGKSSVLMALALRDAGNPATLFSVDVDPDGLRSSAAVAGAHGVADRIVYVRGSVVALRRAMPALRPMLVFVEADHSLEGTRRDLAALEPSVPDGGLLLLHDFHDPRNDDPSDVEYGVVEAVRQSWLVGDCAFGGVFGCSALYRRVRGGPSHAHAPIVDLVSHDEPRLRYLQRVRWPLRRRLRALQARSKRRPLS